MAVDRTKTRSNDCGDFLGVHIHRSPTWHAVHPRSTLRSTSSNPSFSTPRLSDDWCIEHRYLLLPEFVGSMLSLLGTLSFLLDNTCAATIVRNAVSALNNRWSRFPTNSKFITLRDVLVDSLRSSASDTWSDPVQFIRRNLVLDHGVYQIHQPWLLHWSINHARWSRVQTAHARVSNRNR